MLKGSVGNGDGGAGSGGDVDKMINRYMTKGEQY